MTLHDAIEQVLRKNRVPLKAAEIAHHINSERLYLKKDGKKVSGSQISARVSKFPELFKIDELGISLHDKNLKPYRDFFLRSKKLLDLLAPADNARVNDFIASLIILIYYSEHIVTPDHYRNKAKEVLIDLLHDISLKHPKLKNSFDETINYLSKSFSDYDIQRILELITAHRFDQISPPSNKEFNTFFNDIINTSNWKKNSNVSQFSTPKLICDLMCSIYEVSPNALIFDPFAGRCSLLSDLLRKNNNQVGKILAGDINRNAVDIGTLNLYSSGFENFDLSQRNAFTDWGRAINADFTLSSPPFGITIDNPTYYEWIKFPTNDISLNIIQFVIHHTNSNGKIALLLPDSVLYKAKKAAVSVRRWILENELLNGVILLPNSLLRPQTSSTGILLLFDLSKSSRKTGVFFYDASDIEIKDFKEEINTITASFQNEASIKNKARWVQKEEIVSHNYDLSVKKYLLQSFDTDDYVLLKDLIAEHFTGNHISHENINRNEGTPYIQVGDLTEGEGLELYEKHNAKVFVSDTELLGRSIHFIPQGSVLLSKIGTKLKPTLFDQSFQAIASANVIVLKPGPKITAEYLISQLQSEYVLKQINAFRKYNAIPSFNLGSLLNIKIKMLQLSHQQEYVAKYYSRKITDLEKAESKARQDELYNIISRIKHEVKQPVSSIGIDIRVLAEYLKLKEKNKESISLEEFVIDPLEGQSEEDIEATKISSILERICNSVNEAQETLQKAEETLNIGKGSLKLETIELKKFLETEIKPMYSNTNCTIEIKGKEQIINADKYQLKLLFKNLIENSIKHGFSNQRPRKDNIISIELEKNTTKSLVEINFMNNGKPFSKGFNKSFFETQGATTNRNNGSGFGGYHIKKIIENHKGEFHIADDEEVQLTDFKIKFKIYLPLNL